MSPVVANHHAAAVRLARALENAIGPELRCGVSDAHKGGFFVVRAFNCQTLVGRALVVIGKGSGIVYAALDGNRRGQRLGMVEHLAEETESFAELMRGAA